jgi:hypothetical protein
MTKDEVDLEVSVGNLPEALSVLPRDTAAWESVLADELNKQHKAEQALNLIKAKTDLAIRNDPIAYGYPKTTEALIANLITVQQPVIDAEAALVAAKCAVNSTRAIVNALDTKRSACKYLTELVIRGFTNSTPIGMTE